MSFCSVIFDKMDGHEKPDIADEKRDAIVILCGACI